MSALVKLWHAYPAAVTALVVALAAALAVPEAWSKVIVAALALAGGAVTHTQVTPVAGQGG